MKTDFKGRLLVQGAGHAEFSSGFRCALYEDSEGNLYGTADLTPLAELVARNGSYELI